MAVVYPHGMDHLVLGDTETFEWIALIAGNSYDPDAEFVDEAIGAFEATNVTRQTATGWVRSVDTGAASVTYDSDDPDFSGGSFGESITAIILTQVVTNDADSIPLLYQAFAPVDSGTLGVVEIDSVLATLSTV